MKKKQWWAIASLAFFALKTALPVAAEVDGVAELSDIEGVVGRILEEALPLLGLAVGIMVVVGGFQLLTSGGSKEGTQKAKGTLTSAVVGLVVAILAWFILLLIKEFTGSDVTNFVIPS